MTKNNLDRISKHITPTKINSLFHYFCLDCGADTWYNGYKVVPTIGEHYTLCEICWKKRKSLLDTSHNDYEAGLTMIMKQVS